MRDIETAEEIYEKYIQEDDRTYNSLASKRHLFRIKQGRGAFNDKVTFEHFDNYCEIVNMRNDLVGEAFLHRSNEWATMQIGYAIELLDWAIAAWKEMFSNE